MYVISLEICMNWFGKLQTNLTLGEEHSFLLVSHLSLGQPLIINYISLKANGLRGLPSYTRPFKIGLRSEE